MGRVWRIGFLALAFLVACNSNKQAPELVEGPTKELSAIDSLLWRQPDSALAVLQDYLACRGAMIASPETPDGDFIETHAMRLYDQHYANLLLAELLYKNDYAQTNRPALRRAVAYYDSLTFTLNDHSSPHRLIAGGDPLSPTRNDQLFFLSARAHYINGVGYYEHDSVVDACKEYLKALEVMEEHFEEKEMVGKKAKFMAYTYTRLTDLFSDLYLHEQAIYFAQRSMAYYNKPNTIMWYIARMLNEIGSQYDMMDQSDSSACYYKKAMDALDDTTTLLYRDIATHLVFIEYKKGSCQADSATNMLHKLLQSSESERESQARYQNIGEIFYHEKRYDSAWFYLNKVFQTASVVGLKRQAAEWLVEICKIHGMDDSIIEYADFLTPFANLEENKSEIKSELTELYKAFGQTQQERQHQEEMRRHRNRSTRIVAGCCIVTLIIIVLFYYFGQRRKQQYKSLLEAESQAHKMQQAALAGRLKQSNEALKEQLKHNAKTETSNPQLTKADKYEDEPICRHILGLCYDKRNPVKTTVAVNSYADIALTDAQKAELKKAAMAHHASLFEMLKRLHPELKEKDFLYCYLCLLGLDNAQIAVMLQHSLSTIWDREKRLKKILGSEDRVAVILHGLNIG